MKRHPDPNLRMTLASAISNVSHGPSTPFSLLLPRSAGDVEDGGRSGECGRLYRPGLTGSGM